MARRRVRRGGTPIARRDPHLLQQRGDMEAAHLLACLPEQSLKAAIAGKGYRILDDPDAAHFKLQAQVLKVTKADPTAAAAALNAGYGGAIAGMAVGATIGGANNNLRGAGIGAGALAGGLAGTIADAMVKDVTYIAITDVQISQQTKEGLIRNALAKRFRTLASWVSGQI